MIYRNATIEVLPSQVQEEESMAVIADVDGSVDQDRLRMFLRQELDRVNQAGFARVAMPAIGTIHGGFPTVGSAKIITQEIARFLRRQDVCIRHFYVTVEDSENFKLFEKHVYGYLKHLQETLGPGPYVTVDVMIEYADGLVLIERSNPPYGWALPGGFVDYGESLETAVRREAMEETGLELDNLVQMHTYSDPQRDPRFHTISTVFSAVGRGNPRSGDDARDLKVVAFDQLKDQSLAFDHAQVIQDYLTLRNSD